MEEDERFELQKLEGHWKYFDGANNIKALENAWARYRGQYYDHKLGEVAEVRLIQIRPRFKIIWNELI